MFNTILIANRGEIACRIIRTAKRMGVRTVAVYSDADAGALHVTLADEAFRIGPASATESYLSAGRIIAAARASGAEAIHPGYGFLSENADFAEAVEADGMTFIGPPPAAIRAMGLKDAAKALMENAGVPVVPGYHGEEQDPAYLAERAEEIGYPVLIKARAGGGGKGMRRVDEAGEFAAALDAARREAQGAFGDDRVLIESCLIRPRHIEVQVFGDRHGNAVHLFERDCSLQRRHQKVIEEAPAPGMTAEMRRAMGEAAVKATHAIGYHGAGTIEFIADVTTGLWPDRFYFMEMNTRLQVEHPVTEAITGLDLVEWQLRVAAGEPLPKKQADIGLDGWAFEARLYAEDPARGFLPATGRLTHLRFPSEGTRIDSGVRPGDEITPHYDPLIAKLIVHGPNRRAALAMLSNSLEASRVAGVATNTAFLARLSRQEDFAAGHPDTGLIDRELADLTSVEPPGDRILALAGVLSLGVLEERHDSDPWTSLGHWQIWGEMSRVVTLDHAGGHAVLRIAAKGRDMFAVQVEERVLPLRIKGRFDGGCHAEIDGRQITVEMIAAGRAITLFHGGVSDVFHVADPLDGANEGEEGGDRIVAPMPGFIKIVRVVAGDTVKSGDPLIVMEAMKMELTLAAPRDGIVDAVHVAADDKTSEGAVLIALREQET